MVAIVVLHHKHMKLSKSFTPQDHTIAWPVSIGQFVERKSRKRDCCV